MSERGHFHYEDGVLKKSTPARVEMAKLIDMAIQLKFFCVSSHRPYNGPYPEIGELVLSRPAEVREALKDLKSDDMTGSPYLGHK